MPHVRQLQADHGVIPSETTIDATAFAKRFPKLYHLTFAANLPSIQQHGLLSAADLADHYAFTPEEREACLEKRRLCNQDLHGITLRDQHAAPESKMKTCLVNVSIPDWLALLNSKIFFFTELKKAQRMAETYADYQNILLEVDTQSLLDRHAAESFVCRFNSGAVLFKPTPRGRASFIPMAEFELRKKSAPAELTINEPIPAIMDFATIVSIP